MAFNSSDYNTDNIKVQIQIDNPSDLSQYINRNGDVMNGDLVFGLGHNVVFQNGTRQYTAFGASEVQSLETASTSTQFISSDSSGTTINSNLKINGSLDIRDFDLTINKIAGLQDKITSFENYNTLNDSEKATLGANIQANSTSITDIYDEIGNLKTYDSTNDVVIANIQNDIIEIHQETSLLQAYDTRNDENIQSINTSITNINTITEQMTTSINNLILLSATKSDLNETNLHITDLNTSLQEVNTLIDAISNRVTINETDISSIKTTLDSLSSVLSQISVINTNLSQVTSELDSAKTEIQTNKDDISVLKTTSNLHTNQLTNQGILGTTHTSLILNLEQGQTSLTNQLSLKQDVFNVSNRLSANLISDGSISNFEFNTLNGIDTNQTIQYQLNTIKNELQTISGLDDISIAQIQQDISSLGNRTSIVESQLNNNNSVITLLTENVTDLEISTTNAINTKQNLLNSSNKLSSDFVSVSGETLTNKISTISSDLANINTTIQDVLVATIEPQIETINTSIANLTSQTELITSSYLNADNNFTTIISDLSAGLITIKNELTTSYQLSDTALQNSITSQLVDSINSVTNNFTTQINDIVTNYELADTAIQNDIAEISLDVENLKTTTTDLSSQISTTRVDLQAADAALLAEINIAKSNIQSLQAADSTINTGLSNLSAALVQAIDATTTGYEAADLVLQAEINTNKTDIQNLGNTLTSLSSQLVTTTGDLQTADAALQTEINTAKSDIQTLTTSYQLGDSLLNTGLTNLSAELVQARSEITIGYESADTTLQNSINLLSTTLQNDINETNTNVQNLENTLTSVSSQLVANKTELQSADAVLQSEINSAKSDIQTINNELILVNSSLEGLELNKQDKLTILNRLKVENIDFTESNLVYFDINESLNNKLALITNSVTANNLSISNLNENISIINNTDSIQQSNIDTINSTLLLKQDNITESNLLDSSLISTAGDVLLSDKLVNIDSSIATKQDAITSSNKLPYSLIDIQGTQLQTLSTDITNINNAISTLQGLQQGDITSFQAIEENFVTIDNELALKQDVISSSNRLNVTLIADGSISNTEFQYLLGVSSNIQAQLNTKASKNGSSGTGAYSSISYNGVETDISGLVNVDTLKFEDLSEQTTAFTTEIKTDVETAKTDIVGINNSITTITENINTIDETLLTLQPLITSEAKLSIDKVDLTSSGIGTYDTTISTINNNINSLQSAVTTQSTINTNFTTSINNLTSSKQDLIDENNKISSTNILYNSQGLDVALNQFGSEITTNYNLISSNQTENLNSFNDINTQLLDTNTLINSNKSSADISFSEVNSSISSLSNIVLNNKNTQETEINNLSFLISNNKSSTDADIASVSSQVTANKTSADSSIATLTTNLNTLTTTTTNNKVSLDADIADLSSQVTANKTSSDSSVSFLTTEINNLSTITTNNKNTLDNDISNLSATIAFNKTSADSSIATLTTSLNTLSTTTTNNKASLDAEIATLTTLVNSNKSLTDADIASVSSQVTANKTSADSSIATLTTSLNTLSTTTTNNKASLDAEITTLTTLVNSNKTLTDANIADLSSQVTDNKSISDSSIATLTTNLNTLSSLTNTNKTQLDNEIISLTTLVNNNKTLTDDELATLSLEIDTKEPLITLINKLSIDKVDLTGSNLENFDITQPLGAILDGLLNTDTAQLTLINANTANISNLQSADLIIQGELNTLSASITNKQNSITAANLLDASLINTAGDVLLSEKLVGIDSSIATKQDIIDSDNKLPYSLIDVSGSILENLSSDISSITNSISTLQGLQQGDITSFQTINGQIDTINTTLANKQDIISSSNKLNVNLLGDGSMTDLKFSYLNTITSNVQTQINNLVLSGGGIPSISYDGENLETTIMNKTIVDTLKFGDSTQQTTAFSSAIYQQISTNTSSISTINSTLALKQDKIDTNNKLVSDNVSYDGSNVKLTLDAISSDISTLQATDVTQTSNILAIQSAQTAQATLNDSVASDISVLQTTKQNVIDTDNKLNSLYVAYNTTSVKGQLDTNTSAISTNSSDISALQTTKQNVINSGNKLNSLYVDYNGSTSVKAQLDTNTSAIASNTSNITSNTSAIASNTSAIALKANIDNPTFTTGITTPALKMTTGAGVNQVLKSDAQGNGYWGGITLPSVLLDNTNTTNGEYIVPDNAQQMVVKNFNTIQSNFFKYDMLGNYSTPINCFVQDPSTGIIYFAINSIPAGFNPISQYVKPNSDITGKCQIFQFTPNGDLSTLKGGPSGNGGFSAGCLLIADGYLYAAGSFTVLDNPTGTSCPNKLARMNLTTKEWNAIGIATCNGAINALTYVDSVSPPRIYIVGTFTTINNVSCLSKLCYITSDQNNTFTNYNLGTTGAPSVMCCPPGGTKLFIAGTNVTQFQSIAGTGLFYLDVVTGVSTKFNGFNSAQSVYGIYYDAPTNQIVVAGTKTVSGQREFIQLIDYSNLTTITSPAITLHTSSSINASGFSNGVVYLAGTGVYTYGLTNGTLKTIGCLATYTIATDTWEIIATHTSTPNTIFIDSIGKIYYSASSNYMLNVFTKDYVNVTYNGKLLSTLLTIGDSAMVNTYSAGGYKFGQSLVMTGYKI